MEDELPLRTVTCRTTGCENAHIPITLPCGDVAQCGVCLQLITDIVPAP